MRFLKNLRGHEFLCAIIVALLFVQALCDLSLPNYTSDLINVGIQNGGIEYAIPEKISKESYENVAMFLTEEEAADWNDSYKLAGEVYELNKSAKENIKELDEKFATPIVMAYMWEQTQKQENGRVKMQQEMMKNLDEETKLALAGGQITEEELMKQMLPEIRKETEAQLQQMGDTMIHATAVVFVKAEYEKLGMDTDRIQTDYLWRTGAKMLGMALLMALVAVVIGFFAAKVAAAVGKDLREKVFTKVVGFSEAEMKQFSTASLITRSTNDIQQVQMVTVVLLRMVAYAPILAIGGVIMVARTNSGMGWIIVVAIAAILCLVGVLMVIAMPKFKIMQDLVDKVNLVAREILTGVPVIRAFTRERKEEERFDDANKSLTKVMLFTNRAMTFMMPLMMLIMNGISVLIIWTAAHKIDAGTMEIGTMTAFITYTMMIVMSFLMLTMISIMLPRAAVASDRIQEVLDTECSIQDLEQAKKIKNPQGVIRFENVSFAYPDAEGCILKDVDFTAEPGKTTAIIGSTGSGKSTLVQLIPRFYDVTKGRITLDGVDIRELDLHDLRENIGYVPQKGVLFTGTIASNIQYGAKDKTEENMISAAQIAQAAEFIEEKSEKYDSAIAQGGTNVSGGQKQRLSIARAIAKNPKIYIFDDSFSALDFKTDAALRNALTPKVQNSTVLIVAQRISTIMNADQIVVLDDGDVAGIGTHRELMEHCDVYRQIAESQLSQSEIEKSLKNKEKEEQ